MSLNVEKGQNVSLTNGNASLKKIIVGLGWDAASSPSGELKDEIDCDASALLITERTGKMAGPDDMVYYGHLKHRSNSVIHCGDNLTGEGDGDNEQIIIELKRIPPIYSKIVFVVTIYQSKERELHFGLINNAFIRLVDADAGTEICRYNLSENYDGKTAMVFGEIYRYVDEWRFGAIGEGTNDKGIGYLAARFQ